MAISRIVLSGSTNGGAIEVGATGSVTSIPAAPTTIHAAASASGTYDEVWAYAQNRGTSILSLQIMFGASNTSNQIVINVPPRDGPVVVLPGITIRGDAVATPPTISAWASSGTGAGTGIVIFGHVNRMT